MLPVRGKFMTFSFASGEWKERIRMLLRLPYPSRALRFFPPEFTFRNPVLSLVKRYRSQGKSCGLILLYLEDFHHMFSTYSEARLCALQGRIRQTILELLPSCFRDKDVIGVRQFALDDYGIFVKEQAACGFDELQRKARELQKEVSRRLRMHADVDAQAPVSLQSGCYIIGPDLENTSAGIQAAYHYARCIATRKLPPHFCPTREHLLDILKQENIFVLAQPILNLASGELYGWEILTRGPQNSPFHTPAELFDMAYQADLLSSFEFLVIKKAFMEISSRAIQEQVFINVTPVSLGHPLFLHQLLETLKQFPAISASQVVLEITERHAIRDFQYIGAVMNACRVHGFRFAVDDAGAGYSSLQSISELVPDIIKIDRSVIAEIDRMSVKQSLLKALLHFADNMNCQVIAEGVERPEELSMLCEMQVHMVQGFYFARPQPLVTDQERVQQLQLVKEKIVGHRHMHPA